MQVPYAPTPLRLGPYELLKKLATGGMAEIYIARREGPHGFSKRIALKRILPQLAADPEFVAMFIDEARLCAQLTHPNLVQVFDFGEEGDELYMAMELVEGTTAAKVARAAAQRGEPVPPEVALHIALAVGRGLQHAHEAHDDEGRPFGLVHRDVSPGNILISRSGAVKLGDFGIARAAEFERRTDQGQLKGKLGYMSPEQVTGRELDAKSDQFTAAIVLAELLMARPLFAGPREMDVLVKIRDADLSVLERNSRHILPDVMLVLRRALARRRDERFPTTGSYVDALEEVVRSRRLGANPATLVEWLHRAGLIAPTGRSGEHVIDGLVSNAPKVDPNKIDPKEPARSSGALPVAQPVAKMPRADSMSAWSASVASARVESAPSLPPTSPTLSIYRIDRPDQPGAMSLSDVIELFVSGRATAQTPVSRDRGPYRPAYEYPELARLCGGANLWDQARPSVPPMASTIRPGELPGRLFELAARRVTGALVVRHGALEKKAYFVEGVPEVTISTDEKELLGALLVQRGLALPMEIEMGLAVAPRHGGRLGDALVGLGVLRPMELVRAVVDQMRRRFVELVGWKRGELLFTSGARCTDVETLPEAFNPIDLIARGIVEGYSYEDLAAVLAPLEDSLIVPLPRAPVSVSSLKLAQREAALLETVSGRQTLAQVVSDAAQRGIADREMVLRAVFVGLSAGLLVSPGWPPLEHHRETLPTLPLG